MTAAIGLYVNLELPAPWLPATKPTPLIVYGASSAVGAFAIKLAVRSNVHPIIAVGGKGEKFVKSIIDASKGDVFVDYRDGEEKLVEGMKAGLKGAPVYHAYDAISEKGSFQACSKILSEGGKITLVLPTSDFSAIPRTLTSSITYVGLVHENKTMDNKTVNWKNQVNGLDFGYVYFKLFGQGLKEGWFKAHPYEVVPGGLKGIPEALTNLREGKASAVKYLFKIEDTP
jgi:NADPH2:quinone reductase